MGPQGPACPGFLKIPSHKKLERSVPLVSDFDIRGKQDTFARFGNPSGKLHILVYAQGFVKNHALTIRMLERHLKSDLA